MNIMIKAASMNSAEECDMRIVNFLQLIEKCNTSSEADVWQYTFLLSCILIMEAEKKTGLVGIDGFVKAFPNHVGFYNFHEAYISGVPLTKINGILDEILDSLLKYTLDSEYRQLTDKLL
jgi:hypothetical protein